MFDVAPTCDVVLIVFSFRIASCLVQDFGDEKSRPCGRLGRTSKDVRLTNNDDGKRGKARSDVIHALQYHPAPGGSATRKTDVCGKHWG